MVTVEAVSMKHDFEEAQLRVERRTVTRIENVIDRQDSFSYSASNGENSVSLSYDPVSGRVEISMYSGDMRRQLLDNHVRREISMYSGDMT